VSDSLWLVWGSKDPARKPPPRLVKKGQAVYSEANFNLWLGVDSATESVTTDFSLADLLLRLHHPGEPEDVYQLREEGSWRFCRDCVGEAKVPCQLFVRPQPRAWPNEQPFPEAVRSLMRELPSGGEVGEWCPSLRALAEMTETAAERRFFDLYLAYVVAEARPKALPVIRQAMADPAHIEQEMGRAKVGDEVWVFHVHYDLVQLLSTPALLPQGVLNFIGAPDLPEDHPDRHFFDSHVGRVDFVFVHKGRRHIVEIDGHSHHATEKGYTRNLRVDRTLRRQGWQVHRFSNLEVKEATDFQDFARELGFPPMITLRATLW
jgi:hypothetical protein